jgi:hypothetical protein
MVGDYVVGTLVITPMPLDFQPSVRDPLAGLPPIPVATLPVRRIARTTLSGGTTVLEPGVYVGGIQMRNTAKAMLHPGIYVMKGGGFDMGALNAVYSLPSTLNTTTDATWATNCVPATCGVLLFNTDMTGPTDQVAMNAGATMKLRPYRPGADGTGLNAREYENLLFWQDANPVPTNSFKQPDMALSGGGSVDMSGTVYAPSARVYMTGGSGGTGGGATAVTLQFISWDIEFFGNASFHFYYNSSSFARPTDYGLVK